MIVVHVLLRAAALLGLLFAGFAMVEYWFLALAAIAARRNRSAVEAGERPFVLILIPAHDEEKMIGATLRSCLASRYPRDRFSICVVADNCSDRTADIVREHGVECLERKDPGRSGKGQAIHHALERAITHSVDAVMILDADCAISPDALSVIGTHLSIGHPVLQCKVVVANPDDSPVSYMMGVGNYIENDLVYAPRSVLGWTVFLRGTGMVFARTVLEKVRWDAGSNVEDAEFTLALLESGYRIQFLDQVEVGSVFPSSSEQMRVQRGRWASGGASLAKRYAIRSIVRGLRTGNHALADAGQMLLIASKPVVGCCALAQLLLLVIGDGIMGIGTPGWMLVPSIVVIVALISYMAVGAIGFGLSRRRLTLLALTPLSLLRLSGLSLRAIFEIRNGTWSRTPR